jgi:hypothetical protein
MTTVTQAKSATTVSSKVSLDHRAAGVVGLAMISAAVAGLITKSPSSADARGLATTGPAMASVVTELPAASLDFLAGTDHCVGSGYVEFEPEGCTQIFVSARN